MQMTDTILICSNILDVLRKCSRNVSAYSVLMYVWVVICQNEYSESESSHCRICMYWVMIEREAEYVKTYLFIPQQ